MIQPFLAFPQRIAASSAADGINRIPLMTAATTSGVTISCTSENGSFQSWKGADRNNSTPFLTASGTIAAVWKVDFGSGSSFIIQSYSMTELSTEYLGLRYPSSWTFDGSNDNSTWTTLDTKSSQVSVGANNKIVFPITNATGYRYYRINATPNPSSLFGWAEVEMMT